MMDHGDKGSPVTTRRAAGVPVPEAFWKRRVNCWWDSQFIERHAYVGLNEDAHPSASNIGETDQEKSKSPVASFVSLLLFLVSTKPEQPSGFESRTVILSDRASF